MAAIINITIVNPPQEFEEKKYDIYCHIINKSDPENPINRTEVLKPGETREFSVAVTSRFITAYKPSTAL